MTGIRKSDLDVEDATFWIGHRRDFRYVSVECLAWQRFGSNRDLLTFAYGVEVYVRYAECDLNRAGVSKRKGGGALSHKTAFFNTSFSDHAVNRGSQSSVLQSQLYLFKRRI